MVKLEKMVKSEPGECSETLEQPWAKLVPLDSNHSDIEIRSNETVICSDTTFTSGNKHEWCKITRNSDLCSAVLQNLSSTTVIVNGISVEKEDTLAIKCGTEIISGPDKEGYLSYRFRLVALPEYSQKHLKIPIDSEHAKCSICLHIWHDVVTVAPCLHNFCNGCFSEWLRRSQKKNPNVPCPQCRADVHFVGRNHFLHNIEEILRSGKLPSRKRPYSPANAEDDRDELPCPQCESSFGGFQCNQSTSHIQCHACSGMMPSRTSISVPQHCFGCDRAFCWGYWSTQGAFARDSHTICRHENFKPISQHIVTRIPSLTHQSNRIEQEITERCIQQTGKTLQNIILDWISKLNNREIDRTRMPLNHAEMITSETYLCTDCYDKLVSFLLYWFRVTTPKYHLPSARDDCWYGYACRTQHRSEEHARKLNHVCRPTKGSGM